MVWEEEGELVEVILSSLWGSGLWVAQVELVVLEEEGQLVEKELHTWLIFELPPFFK